MGTRGSRLVSCQRLVVGFLPFSPPPGIIFDSCGGIIARAVAVSFPSFPLFLGGLGGLLVESGARWIEKCI